jgi:hypothetical protein
VLVSDDDVGGDATLLRRLPRLVQAADEVLHHRARYWVQPCRGLVVHQNLRKRKPRIGCQAHGKIHQFGPSLSAYPISSEQLAIWSAAEYSSPAVECRKKAQRFFYRWGLREKGADKDVVDCVE